MLRRIFLILATGILGCNPLYAQEPPFSIHIDVSATAIPEDDSKLSLSVFGAIPDNEVWLELQTSHFLVAGTANERSLRKIAADLELLRWLYEIDFPRAHGRSSVPTTVIVFRNGESYFQYRPQENGKSLGSKGYFLPGMGKNYIILNADDGIPSNVARDYIRSLMPDSAGPVPLWFRDGVADYYSTIHINRYYFGKERWTWVGDTPSGYDRALLSPMSPKNMMPIEKLFGIQSDSSEYADVTRRPFSIESWAMISFLFNGRMTGIAAMLRVFNLMADSESLSDAMSEVFGMKVSTFESNFKSYVRAGHSSEFVFRLGGLSLNRKLTEARIICFWCGAFPGSPTTISIPFRYDETLADVVARPVRKLSEGEGYFYRGDLMLHLRRLPEAGVLLARSVKLMPELAPAQAAIGLLRTMEGQFGDASGPIAYSIELDANNYLAYYYDALRIQSESEHGGIPFSDERLLMMHALLEKVVELAPEFVQASRMLAEVNLARGKDLEQSEMLLVRAIQRSPGNAGIFLTLGRVLAQAGDAPSAVWVLNRVIANASADSQTRGDAISLLVRLGPAAYGAAVPTSALGEPKATPLKETGGTVLVKPRQKALADLSPGRDAAIIRGSTIRGILTDVGCTAGITLTIRIGDRTAVLHSSNPSKIAFVSLINDQKNAAILCGPVSDSGVEVTVTYKKAPDGNDILGEPLKVEFN
jgi:hypothetical protein